MQKPNIQKPQKIIKVAVISKNKNLFLFSSCPITITSTQKEQIEKRVTKRVPIRITSFCVIFLARFSISSSTNSGGFFEKKSSVGHWVLHFYFHFLSVRHKLRGGRKRRGQCMGVGRHINGGMGTQHCLE